MTQYIYFVKCPDCEDEIFDFFDEAKEFALSCLSKKPIITQTEVERNDFGECTDSCDLGTIWSWEDIIGEKTESEPAVSVFNKDDLNSSTNCEDSEFDNDVFKVFNDLIKDEHEAIDGYESAEDMINQYDFSSEDKDIILSTLAHIKAEEEEHIDELEKLPYENTATSNSCCKEPEDNFETKEPLIEAKRDSFQEAIFEAIDYLTEFNDIFPVPNNIGVTNWEELKDDIRYGLSSDFEIAEILMEYLDKDLAISRRHPEIFEDDPQSELTLEIYNKLKRVYDRTVTQYKAEHAEDFEESCERKPIPDGMTLKELVEEMEENEDMVECAWCKDLFDKSECRYEVDLGWLCSRCEAAIKFRGKKLTFKENDYCDFLNEAFNPKDTVDFEYDNFTTTVQGNQTAPDEWDEAEYSSSYTYTLTAEEVASDLWENFLTEEDVADVPGGFEALKSSAAWNEFLDTHFDALVEKYYNDLLKFYEERAFEEFEESVSWDDYLEKSGYYDKYEYNYDDDLL